MVRSAEEGPQGDVGKSARLVAPKREGGRGERLPRRLALS
jgi:hypothetical protein